MAEEKPDLSHLAWALDQRVEIQRTLLELYEFVRGNTSDSLRSTPSGDYDFVKPMLLDHLIAAGLSLWRAVFLSESDRDFVAIRKSQEKFPESVLTNNTITYTDDKNNRAWTVSYYLENAKHRLAAAQGLAEHSEAVSLAQPRSSSLSGNLQMKITATMGPDVAMVTDSDDCVRSVSAIRRN